MTRDLIPSVFGRRFPSLSLFEEEDWDWPSVMGTSSSSGLSVSEDKQNVYVEAAVPGLDPEEVEVSFDKGTLWIKGEKKAEKKDEDRKFYRRAHRSYSYRVAVPGNIDENAEPEATYKNGMMKVAFKKQKKEKPKRIKIKSE